MQSITEQFKTFIPLKNYFANYLFFISEFFLKTQREFLEKLISTPKFFLKNLPQF